MTGSGQPPTASEAMSPITTSASDDVPTDGTCLYISTTTWARDSHELFDYEARHVHKRSYFLRRTARIFRTAVDVQVIPDGHPLPTQTSDYLLSVRHRDGRFIVVPADKNVQTTGTTAILPKKVWLIVKELPTGSHQLQEGDIIKLGRFKLRVKQLVKSGPAVPELRLDDSDTPHSTVTPEEATTMQCRICLLDGGTVEDPLVCPCQCKGSIKFVHLDCLRHWINGRLSIPEDEQQQKMSFFFKQLQCELCKTPFPSALMLNNERVHVVKVPKIEAPFIILENVVGTANRGLHVISMETKKELKLGRGHESDVRIADVSISRYHATIRFSDGEFILEDHNSKFGTLVSLRKVQPVDPSHALAVQVGRTILNMSLRCPPCPIEDVLSVNEDPLLSGVDTAVDEATTVNLQCATGNHEPSASSYANAAADSVPQSVGYSQRAAALTLLRQRDLYDRLATAIMAVRDSGMDLDDFLDENNPAWDGTQLVLNLRRELPARRACGLMAGSELPSAHSDRNGSVQSSGGQQSVECCASQQRPTDNSDSTSPNNTGAPGAASRKESASGHANVNIVRPSPLNCHLFNYHVESPVRPAHTPFETHQQSYSSPSVECYLSSMNARSVINPPGNAQPTGVSQPQQQRSPSAGTFSWQQQKVDFALTGSGSSSPNGAPSSSCPQEPPQDLSNFATTQLSAFNFSDSHDRIFQGQGTPANLPSLRSNCYDLPAACRSKENGDDVSGCHEQRAEQRRQSFQDHRGYASIPVSFATTLSENNTLSPEPIPDQ